MTDAPLPPTSTEPAAGGGSPTPTGSAATTAGSPGDTDLDTVARMSVAERTWLGAELDGVHVVHNGSRFPVPGTKAERRAERAVTACFVLSFVAAVAFMVVFCVVPWRFSNTSHTYAWFTPLLGVTTALALGGLGVGAVLWAKMLMPDEETVQERHEGRSSEVDRLTTAATLVDGFEATGLGRRPLLKRSIGLAVGALGVMPLISLIGAMVKKPGQDLLHTPWAEGVALVTYDGRPVRPGDMDPGAIATVFPGVPGGNRASDAPVMLIRLRAGQTVKPRKGQQDYGWQDYIAFSKICTHAGCPVSLYEQQTARLLCPCHQSQFDVLQDGKPVFGPATRSLPALAIKLADAGYFVARGDFREPIGPSFWERR